MVDLVAVQLLVDSTEGARVIALRVRGCLCRLKALMCAMLMVVLMVDLVAVQLLVDLKA